MLSVGLDARFQNDGMQLGVITVAPAHKRVRFGDRSTKGIIEPMLTPYFTDEWKEDILLNPLEPFLLCTCFILATNNKYDVPWTL